MANSPKKVICYLSASAGDWGGASRVLFTNLNLLDKKKYKPIVLLPKEGPILSKLRKLEIHYEIWGAAHELHGYVSYAKHILRAINFFKNNSVDILHINYASYWRPAEIIAAKLLGIPIITHYHVVIENPGPWIKFSSLIVAVSNFTAEKSKPSSLPKRVIYNSVELERYDAARDIHEELGLSKEDLIISFVGQIREMKGIDLFIKLAHSITNKHVIFLIVGECRDPARFKDSYTREVLQKKIKGNKKIKYVGYRLDIENIYRLSDIIIMPSKWEEPFGLINIEAGAARKPIISTRVGGIPEVIRHEENGYLVTRDDLASMLKYAEKLIASPQLRFEMGARGRQIVEKYFTDQPARELENVYEELISRS